MSKKSPHRGATQRGATPRNATQTRPGSLRDLSILEAVAAQLPGRRWDFSDDQLAEIREVWAAVDEGRIPNVGCERLARVMKERHSLRLATPTLAKRLQELRRGQA